MKTVADAVEFVNAQCAFHGKRAQEYARSSPNRSATHAQISSTFDDLARFLSDQAAELERLRRGPVPPAGSRSALQLELRLEDIEGLPDELIKELSITDGDRVDFTIEALMNERGGVMSLDQLLIALFRKTGEVFKRTNLNSRIYRMVTRGALFPVQGRKGVYSTRELTPEELALLDRNSSSAGPSSGEPD